MKVQVLLSTFNGESYLPALLDSLAAQDFADLDVLIRDDGSTERTRRIIEAYAARTRNCEFSFGPRLGFVQSFFTLVERASSAADYYAFCDQDDIWQRDKLSRAVTLLASCPSHMPAMYCSRLAYVDKNLRPLGYSELPSKELSFSNALVECPTLGCTVVFNRAVRQLVLRQVPRQAISHDMWIYLLASAFGKVIFDPEPKILYRKHTANTVGITLGGLETWKIKISRFIQDARLHLIVNQAEEFRRIHGSLLSIEHKALIDRFLESRKCFWNRLRYAATSDVYRQSAVDQVILKARIACDLV